MRIALLSLVLLLTGCSTYLSVSYHLPSKYMFAPNQSLEVVFSHEVPLQYQQEIRTQLEKSSQDHHWWKVLPENKESPDKGKSENYKLYISQVKVNSSLDSEVIEKQVRSASYSANGEIYATLFKGNEKIIPNLHTEQRAYYSSDHEMPKPHSKSSLRPIFEGLLGVDRWQNALDQHNSHLKYQTEKKLAYNLAAKILLTFTPEKSSVRIKLEDDEKDLKPAIEFLKEGKKVEAKNYLEHKLSERERADALFNLAVVKESLGDYQETCPLYQKAHALDKQDRYLAEFIACQERNKYESEVTSLKSSDKDKVTNPASE